MDCKYTGPQSFKNTFPHSLVNKLRRFLLNLDWVVKTFPSMIKFYKGVILYIVILDVSTIFLWSYLTPPPPFWNILTSLEVGEVGKKTPKKRWIISHFYDVTWLIFE